MRIRGHEAFTEFQMVNDRGEQIDDTKDFDGSIPGFDLQEHDHVMSMLILKARDIKDKKAKKQIDEQMQMLSPEII